MKESYKKSDIGRQVITDRYKNPRNKGLKGYGSYNLNKSSCIDDIDVEVKIENGKVADANWDGVACAICTSSTDITIEEIKGKTVEEAIATLDDIINMAEGKEYSEEKINEILVLHKISDHTSRIGCATLGPLGLKKAIEEQSKK